MANKRRLKKHITEAAQDLFSEILFVQMILPVEREAEAEKLLARVATWNEIYLGRVSHPDSKTDGKIVRQYFKNLIDTADKELEEIQRELGELYKSLES
ncbi:MAG: hypothetical protein SPI72_05100 [Porphyromonas sp.]|nr:hypothetical protein [Porphyromonas sp.]